jgi:hypothetical protein
MRLLKKNLSDKLEGSGPWGLSSSSNEVLYISKEITPYTFFIQVKHIQNNNVVYQVQNVKSFYDYFLNTNKNLQTKSSMELLVSVIN